MDGKLIEVKVEDFTSPGLTRLQNDAAALCAALVEDTQRQCARHSEPPPVAVLLLKDDTVKIFRTRELPMPLVEAVSQKLAREWGATAAAFICFGGVADSQEDACDDKSAPAIVVYTETAEGQHAIDFHRPVATNGKISRFVALHRVTGEAAQKSQPFAFFEKER
jgi:hypothetical protein